MAAASQGYHAAEEKLSAETKNVHRAVVSLQDELEAIDWYRQGIDPGNCLAPINAESRLRTLKTNLEPPVAGPRAGLRFLDGCA